MNTKYNNSADFLELNSHPTKKYFRSKQQVWTDVYGSASLPTSISAVNWISIVTIFQLFHHFRSSLNCLIYLSILIVFQIYFSNLSNIACYKIHCNSKVVPCHKPKAEFSSKNCSNTYKKIQYIGQIGLLRIIILMCSSCQSKSSSNIHCIGEYNTWYVSKLFFVKPEDSHACRRKGMSWYIPWYFYFDRSTFGINHLHISSSSSFTVRNPMNKQRPYGLVDFHFL